MSAQFFMWLCMILFVLAEIIVLFGVGRSQFQDFAAYFRDVIMLLLVFSMLLWRSYFPMKEATPLMKKWALFFGVLIVSISFIKFYKTFLM